MDAAKEPHPLEMPEALDGLALPGGVDERLQHLLSRQDQADDLTPAERKEAEGLVGLADMLSLLNVKATNSANME